MEIEPLELRDRRYRAQKALNELGEDQTEERKALEDEIAHYREICTHEHAEEVEGEWRCKDCDLQKTTVEPEPEPEPEPDQEPEAESPAEPEAVATAAAEVAPQAESAPAEEKTPDEG